MCHGQVLHRLQSRQVDPLSLLDPGEWLTHCIAPTADVHRSYGMESTWADCNLPGSEQPGKTKVRSGMTSLYASAGNRSGSCRIPRPACWERGRHGNEETRSRFREGAFRHAWACRKAPATPTFSPELGSIRPRLLYRWPELNKPGFDCTRGEGAGCIEASTFDPPDQPPNRPPAAQLPNLIRSLRVRVALLTSAAGPPL
jgi:hypothetical protein